MRTSPPSISEACRHREDDEQRQPAIGRVVKCLLRQFPTRQGQTQYTKNGAAQHPRQRVKKCLMNPESHARRGEKKEPGAECGRPDVDSRDPAPSLTPRRARAVAQRDRQGDAGAERQHHAKKQAKDQERHLFNLRPGRAGRAKKAIDRDYIKMISFQYQSKVVNTNNTGPSREIVRSALNGWFMLAFNIALLLGGSALLISGIHAREVRGGGDSGIVLALIIQLVAVIFLGGHFALQPNEARVLLLAGKYHGTVRRSGFFWANPFYSRSRAHIPLNASDSNRDHPKRPGGGGLLWRTLSAKISLRARNFTSEKLKVNDKRGNPVEIAAVIVWRVEDTAKAAFDVDNFESYVRIQSESAIRHIASLYSYDRSDEDTELTLRDSADEVAGSLQRELQERLTKAGVTIDEARLTHLAYAPEIAQAMLRRQQAEAVIAARTKIVQGAVSMVEMALNELSAKEVIEMEERKAAMVSNLLVVLCGETEVTPVVNTGTLYT